VGRGNNDNGALKDIQGAFTSHWNIPHLPKAQPSSIRGCHVWDKNISQLLLGPIFPYFPTVQSFFFQQALVIILNASYNIKNPKLLMVVSFG
jgi:hypothetical protein